MSVFAESGRENIRGNYGTPSGALEGRVRVVS